MPESYTTYVTRIEYYNWEACREHRASLGLPPDADDMDCVDKQCHEGCPLSGDAA